MSMRFFCIGIYNDELKASNNLKPIQIKCNETMSRDLYIYTKS